MNDATTAEELLKAKSLSRLHNQEVSASDIAGKPGVGVGTIE